MWLAIQEAGKCKPTLAPAVGAVLAARDFVVCGHRGEENDRDHAEFTILHTKTAGLPLIEAELYVTMEPCSERAVGCATCCDIIVRRQIERVWIGILNPDPKFSGNGLATLRNAGVEVQFFPKSFAPALRAARTGPA